MRLGDYLDKLAWSQADLARHAGISASTVARVIRDEKGTTISRRNAQAICRALSEALGYPVGITDISEIHLSDYRRTRKTPEEKQKRWFSH
jgi:DNA-binding Xre family transcriptional regulator